MGPFIYSDYILTRIIPFENIVKNKQLTTKKLENGSQKKLQTNTTTQYT